MQLLFPKARPLSIRNLAVYGLPLVLLAAALACSFPGFNKSTSTPETPAATAALPAASTPTPQPLPPAVIESNPLPAGDLPLNSPIVVYFNQPMDRASVETAVHLVAAPGVETPSGQITWISDSTLQYAPQAALPPETDLTFEVSAGARSASGLALTQPISLTFHTSGYLRLAENLPATDAADVDPTSAIVAAFSRPVTPLGADPASLPAAFTIETDGAAPQGDGEWINTSTYIFYPRPALEGGKAFTVRLDKDLKAVDGSPLQEAESWSFTTALPRLATVNPSPEAASIWLDTEFVLAFSQAMDAASVQANLSLTGANGAAVPGDVTWDSSGAVITYTPRTLLERGATYTLVVDGKAQGLGGAALGETQRFSWRTVPALAVQSTDPAPGSQQSNFGSVAVVFTAPVLDKDLSKLASFEPAVTNLSSYYDGSERALRFYGDFAPNTDYILRLSPEISDLWGGTLGQEYVLNFRTASLNKNLSIPSTSDAFFVMPGDANLTVQATNIFKLPITLSNVPLADFFPMMGENGYEIQNNYLPAERRSWEQALDIQPDRNQAVQLALSPDGTALSPGIYHLRLDLSPENIQVGPYLIVASNIQLTLKQSAVDVLAWAVDLRTNAPLIDAPVTIYGEDGNPLATGKTDSDGVFRSDIPTLENSYTPTFAVIGQPGQDIFALASSFWSQGVSSWDFDLSSDYSPPRLIAYLYSDRPMYRPGQTVYFRAVVRQAANGRYTLPDLKSLPLTLYGDLGQEIARMELPLSAFGSGHGQYMLPSAAAPGYYRFGSDLVTEAHLEFQVANYRKPEINLQVSFAAEQVLKGKPLEASVSARYFFDAPVSNTPVHWALYAARDYFSLSGYQVGPEDTGWLEAYQMPYFTPPLGELVAEGDAVTQPEGSVKLELPSEPASGETDEPQAQREKKSSRQRYTLEVTTKDESGLPVSARDSVQVNPAEFYIGLRPDAWVGRAGIESGFTVQVVDWEQEPAGVHALRAEFQKVVWVRKDPALSETETGPSYTPQYTAIGSTDFTTDAAGQARIAFTPPEPGTYQLSVFDPAQSKDARSEITLWVGGEGQAIWPNLPNQRLRLTADKDSYQPGETAQVFIPNFFGSPALALVSIERGAILRHQVLRLDSNGASLPLPLSDDDAPNVYLSVTLLGKTEEGRADFRQGYLNLKVEPSAQRLKVTLTNTPQRAGPGETVTFDLLVSDADGKPVQGEFSLAVVDMAALALADPNSIDILPAFYGEQPLGVRTGLALAAYNRRIAFAPAGMGGGGGEAVPPAVVRDRFPDTAYWSAEIVTGPDGKAQIAVPLPDTLTTWKIDARGLTADTRVGQAQSELVSTKELLVRPATPRFLVAGDHAQLAAIVQNNTGDALQATVSLQAAGFVLDDAASAGQKVAIPANERVRVEWWGVAQDVASADLVFSVQASELSDLTRPAQGSLPILHYTSSQTFSTAGVLDQTSETLEQVSLPRSFDPRDGSLKVELSPSLAAAMLQALDVLEHYPYECTEQTLSRFLPNLEAYRALQQFKLQSPDLQARLDRTLSEGLQRLISYQNSDGGFSWWQGSAARQSDPYITAYALFGLSRAAQSSVSVDKKALTRAADFLKAGLPDVAMLAEPWQFDRLAFEYYALSEAAAAGAGEYAAAGPNALFEVRDLLSPWGKALLALTLQRSQPDSEQARTLLSDLQTTASRSATGAHWELGASTAGFEGNALASRQNMVSTLSNSAIVLYTLAQSEPRSPLLVDASRYLMAHRLADGAWTSTYTTAWSLMALTEVMKSTGELEGDFNYTASINGAPLAKGQAGGAEKLTPVSAEISIKNLYPDLPNALTIQRSQGQGRLYYRAALNVSQPVEMVAPLERGLSLSRRYYPGGKTCRESACVSLDTARVGDRISVRLSLTLPQDAYHLVVEDTIPAGAEILDTRIKTSQLGEIAAPEAKPQYDPRQPFAKGWGWWYFNEAEIYDDHIAWAADYLPAGVYELTYTLTALQAGEYKLIPARAWQFYFPEVQGSTSGGEFTIQP